MMKTITKSILCIALIVFFGQAVNAQSIKGKVSDATSGEALIGANVAVLNSSGGIVTGATTDVNGNYSIDNVASGSYVIKAIYVGYADQTKNVAVNADVTLDFMLTESTRTLDQVVVSAGKKAEKVSEAMANIQVVSSRQIDVSQESSLMGVVKNVVGIDFYESGIGQQSVNARGFASVFTGGMLTLVDYRDVHLPGIGGVFSPIISTAKDDVKQIEVIVGPNSALYGASAAQGVINVITKNPKDDPGHSITVGAGNRSQFRLGARSSAMLGEKFAYKIGASYFKASDFEKTTPIIGGADSLGNPIIIGQSEPDFGIKNYVVNGTFYYYPNDNLEISYSAGVSKANFINQSNIGILQIKDWGFQYHQFRVNMNNLFGLQGSAFFQTYFNSNDAGDTYDLEKAKLFQLALGQTKEEAIKNTKFIDKAKQFNIEWQHNFEINPKNQITYGFQYKNTKPDSEGTILDDAEGRPAIEISQTGAYAQYENSMIDNFKFILTGRFDNNSFFGSKFSPKIGVQYKKNGHNLRLVYNQSYTAPPIQPAFSNIFLGNRGLDLYLRGAHKGFDLINVNTGEKSTLPALKSVDTESFEFGYKGLFGDKALLTFTAYHTTQTDFLSGATVINDPANGVFVVGEDGNPLVEVTLSYINFGEVSIDGFDIGLDYELLKNLNLTIGYSYAKFGDFKGVPAGVNAPPPNSPENVAKGSLNFSNWLKKGSFASLSFRYIEEYEWNQARIYQRGVIPTYTVLNLNAEVPFSMGEKGNFAVGVALNNILNNKHVEVIGAPEIGFLGSGYIKLKF